MNVIMIIALITVAPTSWNNVHIFVMPNPEALNTVNAGETQDIVTVSVQMTPSSISQDSNVRIQIALRMLKYYKFSFKLDFIVYVICIFKA